MYPLTKIEKIFLKKVREEFLEYVKDLDLTEKKVFLAIVRLAHLTCGISKKEICFICKTSPQTFSYWNNGIQTPSGYEKRAMMLTVLIEFIRERAAD